MLTGLEVAIIGMAGRFPGARNLEEFWQNLRNGVESVRFFTDEELEAAGIDSGLLENPRYIKAGSVLDDIEYFDAKFFHYSPREAAIIDPQQRTFLETAYEALENAGYSPGEFNGSIGVYAGGSLSGYLANIYSDPSTKGISRLQVLLSNDKDYLATRVSYKLNLEGPSVVVQTACSTSLVAVHLACQSLLSGDCDMAIAGGVSIKVPVVTGYLYSPDEIFSPDGHTRTFDAGAHGTLFGSGVAAVVLRRLSEAMESGDSIGAVIKGSAVNNDGSLKVGYTAPRAEGQAKVIKAALEMAEVRPDDISYIEAHGTATSLGDPIEIAALHEVFQKGCLREKSCAIGSVKTNLGHLDTAAGVTGLIKTVLALQNKEIPPSLHFERANPAIDFARSPFYVNDHLSPWETNALPRRAGVSSFGIGGTNAHVILEEAPEIASVSPSRPWQLLLMSARTSAALEKITDNLAEHLRGRGDLDLADVAFTLHCGRIPYEHRRILVCRDTGEALSLLASRNPDRVLSHFRKKSERRPVVFLFPGGGSQYLRMGQGLYETEVCFREQIDCCAELLQPHLGFDIRLILFPQSGQEEATLQLLADNMQALLVVVEFALAKLWISWGINPESMIGHSTGEYVAACLAGTFDLKGMLDIVTTRESLLRNIPAGAMLSIPAGEADLVPLLSEDLSISVINGPSQCVVSGPEDSLERLQERLSERGLEGRRLRIPYAAHSHCVESVLSLFAEKLAEVEMRPPQIPFVSCMTGTWIRDEEAANPGYWVRHLRETVRFDKCLETILDVSERILLEVGPGRTLSTLAKRYPSRSPEHVILHSIRHSEEDRHDLAVILEALGRLWMAGVKINWQAFYSGERRRRLPLPTYPFERQRHWIEGMRTSLGDAGQRTASELSAFEPEAPLEESGLEVVIFTETQRLLMCIWSDVLGVKVVGPHDHFFECGGDSLLAIQVVSRIWKVFQIEIPAVTLFEAPTIAVLAERVDAKRMAHVGTEPAPPLVPFSRDQAFPLSFSQERLWFLAQLELSNPFYNLPFAVHIAGRLRLDALAASLTGIVGRHEVLRTTFVTVHDQPQQVISPSAEVLPHVIDLSGLDRARSRQTYRRLAAEEAQRPFDLSRGPLLRVSLVCLSTQEHIVLLTFHHIVTDGWSMGLFVRELTNLYRASVECVPPQLPDLPIQYADFALWQRKWLSGETLEKQLAYFRTRLAGVPTVLDLPTDRLRPAAQSFQGGRVRCLLSKESTVALAGFSRAEGATLFMVLLSGFVALLYRLSGQEDLLVGAPVAGRSRVETENLIGLFINTLVLRGDLSGDPTGRDLLARMREATLGAYAHQDLPFERLVEELAPERDLSHAPLIQVLLVLQPAREPLALTDLEFSLEEVGSGTSRFDLTLNMVDSGRELGGYFEYNADLFDPATIERLRSSFETLLAGVVANPNRRLSGVSCLPPSAHHQLLVEWNDTRTSYPVRGGLHDLFAAQAATSPDAVAITFEGTSFTYAELDRRANQVAHFLLRRGIGMDDSVGVFMERSLEMVISLLGILKAGAAYVPFDPSYPQERLAFMLEDSRIRLLLLQERLVGNLADGDVPRVFCDLDRNPFAAESDRDPGVAVPDEAAIYAMYTSGSTGRPKGVVNSHGGLRNRILWMQEAYGLGPADHVLHKTPFGFDVSAWELFWPLAVGARMVVARPEGHQDSVYLARLIVEEGVTTLHFVPPMLRVFLEEPDLVRCRCLRRVICSGEALPADVVELFHQRLDAELQNLYGPTEAAIDVTAWPCLPSSGRRSVLIGRPIANLRIHLLDRTLQPVAMGVPGELHIGGVGLARGYLGRPDLTAERFIPDPLGGEVGGRLYRTGDLASYSADGSIEYLGRNDHQVKLRGFRIELGEIESNLALHPAVQQVVVTLSGRGVRRDSARLVAYLVSNRTSSPSPEELEEFLKPKLPEFMIPSVWVVLPEMPLTPNGKVDRSALLLPEHEARREHVAPRTPTEKALAGIWAEILGLEALSVHESFFRLGGHSLLAMQVMSRLREVLGVELPLRTLFEHPTLASLAAPVDAARGAGVLSSLPPLVRLASSEEPVPLSYAQERLWILHQIHPESPTYNIPVAMQILGPLDAGVLERSLGEIVCRHESLRTQFVEVAGRGTQEVVDLPGQLLPVVDLAGLPVEARMDVLRALARDEARRSFDLRRAPLVRSTLLRLDEGEHVLLLTMHHIVSDGWSMGVLLREAMVLYDSIGRGEPSPLPELPIQYRDFAAWQRQVFDGAALEQEIEHWRERLAGAPELLDLAEKPRPEVQSGHGGVIGRALPGAVVEELRSLCHREGVSLFMGLTAGFYALLHWVSGRDDLIVGTDIADRERAETQGLIGFFVNQLVLRTDLSGDPSIVDLLHRVRSVVLEAFDHQTLPFEVLVSRLNPGRSLGHAPLFQTKILLQHAPLAAPEPGGLVLRRLSLDRTVAQLDLLVLITETDEGLSVAAEYSLDLFSEDFIRLLLGHFERVLEMMAGRPQVSLSELESRLPQSNQVERRTVVTPDRMRLEPLVEYADPRSPAEALLARICVEVLGVERIGVYDRFFSIGGDSIAAIQVASRASREGLQLTPRQLFRHQTIAELASVLGEASISRTTEQGPVTGEVPLTPVQRWFFELQVEDLHHWNQALLFETREQISPTLLETAMDILLTHHDALRMRFVPGGSGWRQLLEEPGAPVPLTHVDLSALSEPGRARALRAAIADAQSSLDLLQGPLLRSVLFTRDGGAPAQILIVVHHLVVDGVSWRILLEDLAALYEQLSRGEGVALPPKTSSFKDWADRLVRFAREDFLEPELAYWLEAPREGVAPLPIDHPGTDNSVASEDSISVALGAEETRALLQRAPEVFRASIDELLLTALARTLARWTGGSSVLVDLEGHGREDLFEELDLSRTVGWFTAMYPIVLDLSRAFRLEDAVRSVKEQVRSIPGRGVVFGIARHLESDSPVARNLRALPRPEIQLNYLGQFDQAMPGGLPFRLSPEPSGPDRSPRGARPHLLEVNGKVGGGRLRLDWLYSRNLHHRSTIERVAQDFLEELRALVDPDQMPAGETLLPSDFPLARFDQEDLSHLASLLNRIDGLEEGEIE